MPPTEVEGYSEKDYTDPYLELLILSLIFEISFTQ